MLAASAAGATTQGAVMGVGVLSAMVVEMLVVMGMGMIVSVCVVVCMAVGHTVVGMFMGMGVGMFVVMGMTAHMIVMQMHGKFSFAFFLYYSRYERLCQNIYFLRLSPHGACGNGKMRV